jgi:CHAT domain-containing protein/tetratricopeptide (TPR) repeat protein
MDEVERALLQFNTDLRRLSEEGELAEFRDLARQAATYGRLHLAAADPNLGVLLLNLANAERDLGRHLDAIGPCEEAAVIFSGSHDTLREYVLAVNNWGELLSRTGELAKAEALFSEAARVSKAGGFDQAFATAQNNIGFLHIATGRYKTGERRIRLALRVRRQTLPPDHPEIANSLNNLGDLYVRNGAYKKARKMFDKALRIRAAAAVTDTGSKASSSNNMAALYGKLGDYASAENLFQEALGMLATEGSPAHLGVLASLEDNYGMLLGSLGRFAEAEELCRRALDRRRQMLPETHPDVASSLSNIAKLRFGIGDYAGSLKLQTESLEIRRRPGSNKLDIALSLSASVEVYCAVGNYEVANRVCNEALEIRRNVLGDNHLDTLVSLADLAAIRSLRGDFVGARQLLEQVLERRTAVLGKFHPDVASAQSNLAALLINHSLHAEAAPLLARALEIRQRSLGKNHPDTARALLSIGALAYQTRDYPSARKNFDDALAILSSSLDPNHPRITDLLHRLAMVDAADGNVDLSLARMLDAISREDATLENVLAFGTEQQRIAFLDRSRQHLHRLLALVVTHFRQSFGAARAALNCVIRRKGLVLTATSIQRTLMHQSGDVALQDLLHKQVALDAQITRSSLEGPWGMTAQLHRKMLAQWVAEREAIEDQIARRIPIRMSDPGAFDLDRIAAAMPASSVLAVYVRFPMFQFAYVPSAGPSKGKADRYAVLLLPAGATDNVCMLDLGEAEAIDGAIAQFRASLTNRVSVPDPVPAGDSSTDALGDGSDLRGMVLDPLTSRSPGTTRWIVAPDSNISWLPFDALPATDGNRVFDRYTLSYVSSARDLTRPRVTAPTGLPLIVAAPDFDLASVRTDAMPSGELDWGPVTRSLAGSGVQFGRIDGTRAEGDAIAGIAGTKALMGAAALESAVRAAKSPVLIHLATHGFFLPDRPLRPRAAELPDDPEGTLSAAENPMLRSGLALAGANTWLRAQPTLPEAEDGILTAQDVCGLDLAGTELAVLSACDTALGALHPGEGVFGLRRAFAIAGARTLIMSLWKVPDNETRELMVLFYQNLFAGVSRLDALRAAQAAIRVEHPAPYYWAAFICEGEIGPLITSTVIPPISTSHP